MEEKRKGLDWKAVGVLIAIALAGASLFLVLYNSPEAAAKRELRELEKQLTQQEEQEKKEAEERQEEAENYFASEDGGGEATLKELDERYRAEIVELVNNNGIVGDMGLGYTIDTEDELASLKFYDIYVTGTEVCREKNFNCDLAVRYIYQVDRYEGIFVFTRYYKFDDSLNSTYRNFYSFQLTSLEELVDCMKKHAGEITPTPTEYSIYDDFCEDEDDLMEGYMTRFTAEDFEAALAAEEETQ